MKNSIGREIPQCVLDMGYRPYAGGGEPEPFKKTGPLVRPKNNSDSKVVASIEKAIKLCGMRDGMTISFHHHFRDGDYVVNMVMEKIVEMGFKDITIAASSLGAAHDPVAEYIEMGIVTGLQTSGIRGRIGEAVSHGKLRTPAILRSHGGRVRAIENGEVHIDIAFIGAPTCDSQGNARGKGGKSDCGVLSYAMVDARHADRVVVITDTLVEYPNFPPSIEAIDVDYVVVVDEIGNPKKIASQAARMSQDPRDLLMASACAKVMAATDYFKDGFSFQTGAGGPSLAANRFIEPLLRQMDIKIKWIIGGISQPAVELMQKGLVENIVDAQDFDVPSVQSVGENPRHFEISTAQYASPSNKGAFVNQLDYVILAALEIDVDFNVNVITGSDGILRGAPGGHPDAAAGAKCTIIVTPLMRGRMATVCERVVTVTTPGDTVDVLVTDYGIAVNPRRPDLKKSLEDAGMELVDINTLKDMAYAIVGRPDPLDFDERVVAIMEARDGTVLDVVRKTKSAK
ncbi:MAG: citrate lyase subunit alpha [Clostridia bacterium]|nr:citrate lyase subunit alpha [Clostridia bacterium]